MTMIQPPASTEQPAAAPPAERRAWSIPGGVALVLDMFDPDAAREFDAELGVNHTALVFEFNHADISGLWMSNRLHVGDDTWSLGLMMQF